MNKKPRTPTHEKTLGAFVIHPEIRELGHSSAYDPQFKLEEAIGLAQAIQLDVTHQDIINLKRPQANTLFGKGTVSRIFELTKASPPQVIIINHPLSPIQQRNLEKAWGVKVIDRTGLILEIFGDRAQTTEGRLQVELATLSYQRSRLVRSWTHLERQRGGLGAMGGPGETQLEVDRRLIDERLSRLKSQLKSVTKSREIQRRARMRVPYPTVALVGYTNAGKSTLFNALTESDVFTKDLLFATLDPKMTSLKLSSGQKIILSDTVGFISDLPTQLIASFRATLEEVISADLILHVRDISTPYTQQQKKDVETILQDLGAYKKTKILEVLNKVDLLEKPLDEDIPGTQYSVSVSALQKQGLKTLCDKICQIFSRFSRTFEADIPYSEAEAVAWLYEHGDIIKRENFDTETYIMARLTDTQKAHFHERFPQIPLKQPAEA